MRTACRLDSGTPSRGCSFSPCAAPDVLRTPPPSCADVSARTQSVVAAAAWLRKDERRLPKDVLLRATDCGEDDAYLRQNLGQMPNTLWSEPEAGGPEGLRVGHFSYGNPWHRSSKAYVPQVRADLTVDKWLCSRRPWGLGAGGYITV